MEAGALERERPSARGTGYRRPSGYIWSQAARAYRSISGSFMAAASEAMAIEAPG